MSPSFKLETLNCLTIKSLIVHSDPTIFHDSLAILSLVAEIEEEFDVVIPTVEIIPDNFNSAKSLWALIEKLKEEE